MNIIHPSTKILSEKNLLLSLQDYKNQGLKICCVTGCMDVLTIGHISYLEFASKQADILVIGLDSDTSITKLKGPNRPINNENWRAKFLSHIEFVDYVSIQNNTAKFLKEVKPDIWCKGADWTINTLNKSEILAVKEAKGEIVFAPRIFDVSTTKILQKLNENQNINAY